MNHLRYAELMGTVNAALTEAERREGYHFCPSWDFLLITPKSPEAECCTCAPYKGGVI